MNNHPENQNLSGREASASESKFKKKNSYFWREHPWWHKIS